ncbi:MAG TPA: thioredoxin family protein, partial [Pirellulales bacterium]|nr:thioredoxin family protein [Pirellulales bacterium]
CEIRDTEPVQNTAQAEANHPLSAPNVDGEGISRGRIAFIEGFERGYEKARAQQKPMLLFFTAAWCKYCHQMAQEAFVQDGVIELSQNFVCVLVDADAEPQVCRQFEVRGFPTIQFVSSQGTRLNRITGKQPAHQLIAQMQAALHALARRRETTLQR